MVDRKVLVWVKGKVVTDLRRYVLDMAFDKRNYEDSCLAWDNICFVIDEEVPILTTFVDVLVSDYVDGD